MNPAPRTSPGIPATRAVHAAANGNHLRRLRWAVRTTLTLGVAASVAANVLHARPNPISQIIAAWPPLALLLTVELISRVPHHRWILGAIRITAAATIAIIAGWVSYWHLVGVAARYGETGYGAAYLLPISVDGLVIVASVSLVEITARIRATTPTAADAAAGGQHATTTPTSRRSGGRHINPGPRSSSDGPGTGTPAPGSVSKPAAERRRGRSDNNEAPQSPSRQASNIPQPSSGGRAGVDRAGLINATPADDVPTSTAAAVAYWRRRDPTMHPADIAARIGKSERTVRRHWSLTTVTASRAPTYRAHSHHR